MPRDEQETYIQRLAKLGYCWQFITLAGLHQSALMADTFSKAYAKQGMRAYGEPGRCAEASEVEWCELRG
jgi:isocitrate lyase